LTAPLIGLYSPRAQSGKSTAARRMAKMTNGVTMSFADPMREAIVPIAAPFVPGGEAEVRQWFLDERKDKATIPQLGVTLRFLLQTIGTAWGRETIHPDVWEMIAKETSRKHRKHKVTVIDDVRFENEYAMIKREGGLLIKIVRPDAPVSGNFWHKSEARLEGLVFDETIVNDQTEGHLKSQIDDLLFDLYGV
jgi:hypothetical protein